MAPSRRSSNSIILDDRSVLDRIGAPARAVLALLSPLAAPANEPLGPLGRHQVVGAVRRLLLAAAAETDILLQVDDAHLIDDADVDVLVQLATAGAPVCLLLATRPLAPHHGTVARRHAAATCRRIADRRPGAARRRRKPPSGHTRVAHAPTRGVVERIVQAAEGNPFAAIELARCAPAATTSACPAAPREAITERLCDVPDDALAVLRWLALGGGELDMRTVEALTTLAQAPTYAALDRGSGGRRPGAGGRALPFSARAGAPGADRPGTAPSQAQDAPRHCRAHWPTSTPRRRLSPATGSNAGRPREAQPWLLARRA